METKTAMIARGGRKTGEKHERVIFCDGSSLGNPGPGGWGVVVMRGMGKKEEDIFEECGGGEAYTTNNKMELTAAINALAKVGEGERVRVCTDSTYVINGITKWIFGWQKNGWRTANKKPVENRGLWEELMRMAEGRDIQWEFVRGHSGIFGNERADAIARTYATEYAAETETEVGR